MTLAELASEHDAEVRAQPRRIGTMDTKAYYYRDNGERVGPLPANGNWPATYGERGLYLQPPAARRALLCIDTECERSLEGNGFVSEDELVAHAKDAHGCEVFRSLRTGELAYDEIVVAEDDETPEDPAKASSADGGAGAKGNK